jgi:hypothetical protein
MYFAKQQHYYCNNWLGNIDERQIHKAPYPTFQKRSFKVDLSYIYNIRGFHCDNSIYSYSVSWTRAPLSIIFPFPPRRELKQNYTIQGDRPQGGLQLLTTAGGGEGRQEWAAAAADSCRAGKVREGVLKIPLSFWRAQILKCSTDTSGHRYCVAFPTCSTNA